jgi:diacylglycerol kinase family enzyme
LEIDDGSLNIKNLNSQIIWVYNGKFGGGGMCLSPLGLVNDGYNEITFCRDLIPLSRMLNLFMTADRGHLIYDEELKIIRFKNLKLINKSLSPEIDPVTN